MMSGCSRSDQRSANTFLGKTFVEGTNFAVTLDETETIQIEVSGVTPIESKEEGTTDNDKAKASAKKKKLIQKSDRRTALMALQERTGPSTSSDK